MESLADKLSGPKVMWRDTASSPDSLKLKENDLF
jgi:hypothetical protein